MGFLDNTSGYELTAKLTPQGRKKIVTSSNALITYFSLGDSDSYYGSTNILTGGQVPVISGDNNGVDANSGGANYVMRSTLKVKGSTSLNTPSRSSDKKAVEIASISVNSTQQFIGYQTLPFSGSYITQNLIDINDIATDSLTNLFYSFGLPIGSVEMNNYSGRTSTNGGWSDTALSGLAQEKILVISIDESKYSELIDGKSINTAITTSAGTYNIYGTYQNKSGSLTNEDKAIYDTSANIIQFGPNRTLLFSDDIKKPNGGDAAKSWATGYSKLRAFSIGNKERWNIKTDSTISLSADTPIGIAYLDKGMLVITDPTIVNSYNASFSGTTGTSITYNSAKTKVTQSITCIAQRGEFGTSTNSSWSPGDTPRITELGLWDATGTLIAIGKLNKTYEKPSADFVAFNVTIDY